MTSPDKSNIRVSTTLTKEEQEHCDALFRSILSTIRKNAVPDCGTLRRAYDFAYACHDGQRRKGGAPYIVHGLETAKILAEAGFTETALICSAMLHDVVEDCGVSVGELAGLFSEEIAEAVDGVSNIDNILSGDPEIQKDDLDAMSDVKFLNVTEVLHNRRAFYIRLADRIHNLRTIFSFPEEKQKAKALHTRNILIPAAKELHIYTLIDVLENLCLQIENPTLFAAVSSAYAGILRENRSTLTGPNGLQQFFLDRMKACGPYVRNGVVSLIFKERKPESISRNLPPLDDLHDLSRYLTKEYIPIYDIKFIVTDLYQEDSAADVFFKLYPALHSGRQQFTIIGKGYAVGTGNPYFICEDRYGCRYRLFIMKEADTLRYLYGSCMDGSEDDLRSHIPYINTAQPDEPRTKVIRIYRRNGKADKIEEGATVLDFAFRLNPAIGLCAKGARINGSTTVMPVHTRLRPGDMVDVQSDHIDPKDREKEEFRDRSDIPHATIRWFEYLHTRSAVRDLSRWFEERADIQDTKILVYFRKQEHHIPIGSTVLDFAVNTLPDPFHGFDAFINKSKTPADISKVLRHRDIVSLRFGEGTAALPDLEWFRILKTEQAKQKLIDYFRSTGTGSVK